jgi:hypothetical protein
MFTDYICQRCQFAFSTLSGLREFCNICEAVVNEEQRLARVVAIAEGARYYRRKGLWELARQLEADLKAVSSVRRRIQESGLNLVTHANATASARTRSSA